MGHIIFYYLFCDDFHKQIYVFSIPKYTFISVFVCTTLNEFLSIDFHEKYALFFAQLKYSFVRLGDNSYQIFVTKSILCEYRIWYRFEYTRDALSLGRQNSYLYICIYIYVSETTMRNVIDHELIRG